MMVSSLRNAFLTYFLALAPSLAIFKSLILKVPSHDESIDRPTLQKPEYDERSSEYLENVAFSFQGFSTISNSTALTFTNTTKSSEVKTFAACLLLMDDNPILPEFLAYHYLRLPLQRLIVAIDPRSETSPMEILNRYKRRGLMDITVWGDDDFMLPDHKEIREGINRVKRKQGKAIEDPFVLLHRDRQSYFISKCFNTLRSEGAKWVVHLDTDEYILPNYAAGPPYKVNTNTIESVDVSPSPTIFDMIQSMKHIDGHLGSACISLPRVRISTKESSEHDVSTRFPIELQASINASNLQTFRWRWRNNLKNGLKSNGRAKAMVDVSRISSRSRRRNVQDHNPHRPVKQCLVRNMYMDVRNSTFLVHHYASSWEQWTSRKRDARQTTKNNGRTREAWEKLKGLGVRETDHIRGWLQEFVGIYGVNLTLELLGGVGELPLKPVAPFPHTNENQNVSVGVAIASAGRR